MIVWFSPLPPAPTDIANYTARLWPHLTALADVRLVCPDAAPVDADWPARAVGALDAPELNAADVCVYNLGNNVAFHSQIFATARARPGIVILHDQALHEFMLGYHLAAFRADRRAGEAAYTAQLGEWYGAPGRDIAAQVLTGRIPAHRAAISFRLYEPALHRALGVVSHNPTMSRQVRQSFPNLPLLDLALPYPAPLAPAARAPRHADAPIRLVMFGFMGANRRGRQFVEIWAQSPWRHRFTLDLAGEMGDRTAFDAAVAAAGLGAQVQHHGFLSESALDALLHRADLAINLRHPTAGEASGSQLRIWASALASIVTAAGWYGALPPDTVIRIDPDREREEIAALLTGIVGGQIDLPAIGASGARQLAAHDPADYARRLVDWLRDEHATMAARWTEYAMIDRVADAVAQCVPSDFDARFPPLFAAE